MMYEKPIFDSFYDKLLAYFKSTPKEQLKKDMNPTTEVKGLNKLYDAVFNLINEMEIDFDASQNFTNVNFNYKDYIITFNVEYIFEVFNFREETDAEPQEKDIEYTIKDVYNVVLLHKTTPHFMEVLDSTDLTELLKELLLCKKEFVTNDKSKIKYIT